MKLFYMQVFLEWNLVGDIDIDNLVILILAKDCPHDFFFPKYSLISDFSPTPPKSQKDPEE